MLIVDSLIISGVKFVLTRLAEAVEAEMYDETALREELLAAQMKLELGEIDDAEFEAVEAEVLRGLREVQERKRSAAEPDPGGGTKLRVESVDAELGHEG